MSRAYCRWRWLKAESFRRPLAARMNAAGRRIAIWQRPGVIYCSREPVPAYSLRENSAIAVCSVCPTTLSCCCAATCSACELSAPQTTPPAIASTSNDMPKSKNPDCRFERLSDFICCYPMLMAGRGRRFAFADERSCRKQSDCRRSRGCIAPPPATMRIIGRAGCRDPQGFLKYFSNFFLSAPLALATRYLSPAVRQSCIPGDGFIPVSRANYVNLWGWPAPAAGITSHGKTT